MLWITFIQKKKPTLKVGFFSRYILFRSKNLVAGIAETGNDIPVLVQSLIDRGGVQLNVRVGFLQRGNTFRRATSTSTLMLVQPAFSADR